MLFDGIEATSKKKPGYKPKRKLEIPEGMELKSSKIDNLIEEAQRAVLIKQIKEAALITFKTDKEEIELKKSAGELIEYSLADFLFFGYLEKVNTELIQITKRNAARLGNMIKDKDEAGVYKLINSEIKAVIKEVKRSQAEAIESWKRS